MLVIKFKEVCTIQFTCTGNIGNKLKQYENLKKKLKGLNTCCFSTIPVKI